MLEFNIETEEIAVFEIGDRYISKKHFDEDRLFKQ